MLILCLKIYTNTYHQIGPIVYHDYCVQSDLSENLMTFKFSEQFTMHSAVDDTPRNQELRKRFRPWIYNCRQLKACFWRK